MRSTLAVTLFWAVMVCWTVWGSAVAAETPSPSPVLVNVEQGDGIVTAGRLERIDDAGVHVVEAAAGNATLPADRVRVVRRTDGGKDGPHRLVLTLVDGSTLSGDDFAWDGKQPAVLLRPEGRIELPAGRVRSLAWHQEAPAAAVPPAWQGAIPEGTESDLVVVGTSESYEFVECAITGVSADTVTVVLDEETIPVKRSKVIGLRWLRGEPAAEADGASRAIVSVSGGGVRARRVEWSADALVIDGEIRLPSAMFSSVDYAAGRLVSLAGLTPEKVEVEPWFGGLTAGSERTSGLASFFAPRTIDAVDGAVAAPGIIMRPRTVAVWRLPPDSRRFRAVVASAAGAQAADAAMVVVVADDRELFRRQIDAGAASAGGASEQGGEGIPIDIDLTSARRLTVKVEFVPGGGIGGAVRFTSPVVER